MKSQVCVSVETLSGNLASALHRGLPYLDIGEPLSQKVAVVAGGPSAKDYLEDIREWDGFVVAINGVHDWLVEEGIIPDAVIAVDPQPELAEYFQNPNDHTTYLIASCCAPEVFDALEGKRIVVWHAAQGGLSGPGMLVNGGPTAATRAPHVLYMMGFREVHMFGVDSSYTGLKTHAYKNGRVNGDNIQVRVEDEIFITSCGMLCQAEFLETTRKEFDGKFEVHGYGLGPALVNNGNYEVL